MLDNAQCITVMNKIELASLLKRILKVFFCMWCNLNSRAKILIIEVFIIMINNKIVTTKLF
jgi:hypothetical protein